LLYLAPIVLFLNVDESQIIKIPSIGLWYIGM